MLITTLAPLSSVRCAARCALRDRARRPCSSGTRGASPTETTRAEGRWRASRPTRRGAPAPSASAPRTRASYGAAPRESPRGRRVRRSPSPGGTILLWDPSLKESSSLSRGSLLPFPRFGFGLGLGLGLVYFEI